MTGSPARPGRPVGAEVQQLVGRVVAHAHQTGQAQLGQRLQAEVTRRYGGPATVVVAGEIKQGKSSLVNALVGRPGLSPVGDEVLTGTYVWLRPATEPVARVHLHDAAGPRDIALDQIGRWASVEGNPGNRARVRCVEVALDAPILAGLHLIDTPGVGGLEQGYSEITLMALEQASALLFVTDGGAPLSGPELAFLRRASERLDTVIVAVTKTDLYRGWREVADENRTLLRAHAPALAHAPLVGVSSALAETAEACHPDQQELRDRLRALAGVEELTALLRTRVSQRAAIVALANTVQLTRHVLGTLERSLATSPEAVEADPALQAALVAEQEQLAGLRKENLTWGPRFAHQMKRLRIELGAELSHAVNALGRRYEEQLPRRKAADLELLPSELEADIAALAGRHFEVLVGRLREVAMALLGDLVDEAILAAEVERLSLSGDEVPQVGPPAAKGRANSPTELFASFSSFLAGRTAATLFLSKEAGSSALLGLGSLPVAGIAVGAGVALAWVGRAIRSRAGRKAELLQWVRRELAQASQELRKAAELAVNDAELALGMAMRSYVERRTAEINATLEQVKAARDRDLAGRLAARKRVGERQLALRKLDQTAGELLGVLRGAEGGGSSGPLESGN